MLVLAVNWFKYISCSYLSFAYNTNHVEERMFKYISCSYLSYTDVIQRRTQSGLNTSHVLIYRNMTIAK